MMLVDLEDAKARLRIVHDGDDYDVELMIRQASAAVMNYLGKPLDFYETDSEYAGEVPQEVQLATLLLVGILYRDRDGVEAKDWPHGFLPHPVTAFLYPLRDPAMG